MKAKKKKKKNNDFTVNSYASVQWRFPAAGFPLLSVQFPALVSSYSLVQKQPPAIPGFVLHVWGIVGCNWLSDSTAATEYKAVQYLNVMNFEQDWRVLGLESVGCDFKFQMLITTFNQVFKEQRQECCLDIYVLIFCFFS